MNIQVNEWINYASPWGSDNKSMSFLVYWKELISLKQIVAPVYNSYKILSMFLSISPQFSQPQDDHIKDIPSFILMQNKII